jgi:hypothetical protein
MAFTWNGAAACLNSGVDPVKLLSIKVNGGMDFNSGVLGLLGDALRYDFAMGMRVVMHFGNSRVDVGHQRMLRSNMDGVLPIDLQTASFTASEAAKVKGGMKIRREWIKCLMYIYDNFPEMFVDETNLALFARNGCLKDLLDICVHAVYGSDLERNVENPAHAGCRVSVPKTKIPRVSRKIANGYRFMNAYPGVFPVGVNPVGTIFEFRVFERSVVEGGGYRMTSREKVAKRREELFAGFQESGAEAFKTWCYDQDLLYDVRHRLETIRSTNDESGYIKKYQEWCRTQEVEKQQGARVHRQTMERKRYDSVCCAMEGFDVKNLCADSNISETNRVAQLFQVST